MVNGSFSKAFEIISGKTDQILEFFDWGLKQADLAQIIWLFRFRISRISRE
jgi:hypothetical protein